MVTIKTSALSKLISLASSAPQTTEFVSALLYSLDLITAPTDGTLTNPSLQDSLNLFSSLVSRIQSGPLSAGILPLTVDILSNTLAQLASQSSPDASLMLEVVTLIEDITNAMLAEMSQGESPLILPMTDITISLFIESFGVANGNGASAGAGSSTPTFTLPVGFLDSQGSLNASDNVEFTYTLFDINPFGGVDVGHTLQSPVVGLELSANGDILSIHGLSEPIVITITPSSPISSTEQTTLECIYWNVANNSWSTDGCNASLHGSTVECSCTHLTYFSIWTNSGAGTSLDGSKGKSSWPVGNIVGVAIGGFAAVALIVGGAIGVTRYRRRQPARANRPAPASQDPAVVAAIPAPVPVLVPVPEPVPEPTIEPQEEPELRIATPPVRNASPIPVVLSPGQIPAELAGPTDLPMVVQEFNNVLAEYEEKERLGLNTPPSLNPSPNKASASSSSKKKKYGPYNSNHERAASTIQRLWRRYQSQIDRRRVVEIEQLLYDIDELLADESDPFDLDELDIN